MLTPLRRIAAVALLLAVGGLPSLTAAQTASATTQYRDWDPSRIFEWRRQNSELRQKIDALGTVAAPLISIPILFGVAVNSITPNFGDARGGGTRTHEGEDMMAPKGTPIVSPTPAVVIETGNGESSGLYVTTANPGGETFVYMHLDTIGEGVAEGAMLQTGALIGYVGNTGNASGGLSHLHLEIRKDQATDPYPRLKLEFTMQEKIASLTTILAQSSDSVALAQLLVANFRTVFLQAQRDGIILPPLITGALGTAAMVPAQAGALPAGDLELGSSGADVVTVQRFLILKAPGSAAVKLAAAGATGYFGAVTQSALIEYQRSVGITPADGYYGPATRAYVEAGAVPSTPNNSSAAPAAFTRDLKRGTAGDDVRQLQKVLNAKGFLVATTGVGSVGLESTYFGPATAAAVIRFQKARSITPAVGYVGPITRAALAQ